MLCRPPMTSLRRGWMELPDVGDLCLLVIQKWMDHIMLWSHFTFYVFDMISKALAMFLCMLWIRMKWMHRHVTFELLFMFCSLIYLWNVISLCYTLKTTICHRYAPYANDMLQLPFLDCMNKTCFERYDIVILRSNKTCYCFILYLRFVFGYLICLKPVLFAMDMLVICWALYAHPVAI